MGHSLRESVDLAYLLLWGPRDCDGLEGGKELPEVVRDFSDPPLARLIRPSQDVHGEAVIGSNEDPLAALCPGTSQPADEGRYFRAVVSDTLTVEPSLLDPVSLLDR